MDLVAAVRAAGVIGAGGAGFPTHEKLKTSVELVIVNGMECEPLLRVDQELMAHQAPVLVKALSAVLHATGARQGVFALKAKYERAAEAIREELGTRTALRLALAGDFYPIGDEHVLVQEVSGRTVPSGGIPPEVGAVVINVETLLNVARAIEEKPVVSKYVTVAGAVSRPATLAVPIGVSLAELIALAGGATVPKYGLIDGGPLMGRLASSTDVVTKTTKGIIVLPDGHAGLIARQVPLGAQIRRAASACCGCRMCTDLCPRYLLGHELKPHQTLNAATHGLVVGSTPYAQAYLCSECGICDSYACPMGLSPRRLHVEMKKELARAGIANPYRGRAAVPRSEWAWRKVPTARIVSRTDIGAYNVAAPMMVLDYKPRRVFIPLRQGVGAAALPTVRSGDYVYHGQCVAAPPAGKAGACHHASIDGRIVHIDASIEIEAV